ncbi:Predicted Zn-dependent peptidase [Sphingomonas sp. OV641]|uniref:M16 family metallopeptidase n=1 Tax=Sphingomonas sp. OV641 TaxID=1881068 RepID=UPI0008BDEA77|nr:pitrilysin family protein [Sphingomonas sp. OV641]SEJ60452.1 Predicted Zn-dependent peptidase [Sphingomonas sp. OV641]
MRLSISLAASVAALALVPPSFAQTTPQPGVAATADRPAPVADLVGAIDIPYQQFTLPNGLRVVVHTDRKAPVVAVSVWYDVGSKHEPAGKTGFAHLFEHLMFNGSENAPGDFFEPLKQVGATDLNGTTYFDRTNYFETVPTAALEQALYLESDRMGWLTGAISQAVLDEQRGVVQNEKREGDNQPYGLISYKLIEGVFPDAHPYGHSTIGSMADLDKASLQDVKDWFRDHYGPNNAVLVLAGDIDVPTAKRLTAKYFGAIKRGPESVAPQAAVPVLAQPRSEVMKDRVAAPLVVKSWPVPGLNDAAAPALEVAASVLGGLASSRFDNALVKGDKTAVQVSASYSDFAQVGTFTIHAMVRPGVDPAIVSRRLDELVAEFIRNGPTPDEVQRTLTTTISRRIGGLEAVGGFGGKAVALAEGALYSDDPGFYKKQLAALAAQMPASVKAAAQQWLTRPNYSLTVVPGERDAYEEAMVPPPAEQTKAPEAPAKGTREPMPPVGEVGALAFPKVERAQLSNGVELVYAQRATVPITQMVASFDAGAAADVADQLGTQSMTLAMIDEGTARLNSIQLAEAKERLGLDIFTGSSADRTTVSFRAPSANLGPALDIWAELLRAPSFPDSELARVRAQMLTQIAQEQTDPEGIEQRILPPILYGPAHPYAKNQGSGDAEAVAALTRADLVAFHHAWLRPDKAKVFVVSDRPLAEVKAGLDRALAGWKGEGAAGTKVFREDRSLPVPRIVLVDRPDSPQSRIAGVLRTGLRGTDDLLPVITANDALGGDFLGRINMDLRETKHWSYGAYGGFARHAEAAPYQLRAPVQADKTGASIAAMKAEIGAFVGNRPMSEAEFQRTITGATRSLAGDFETSGAVLGAMQANDLYRRPDDYYATITQRYRAMTRDQLNGAIRSVIDPNRFIWVVIGDAKAVRPQLDTLGLPVEVMPAASVTGAPEESE